MPCNYNCVCFECRISYKLRGGGTCPICKRNLMTLGYQIEIPPKHNIKAWKKLEKRISNSPNIHIRQSYYNHLISNH